METEKRYLQIDLETARYIYKMNKPVDPEKTSIYGNIFLGLIKGAFTVEELEGTVDSDIVVIGDSLTLFKMNAEKQAGKTTDYIPTKTIEELKNSVDDYRFQQEMGFKKEQEKVSPPFTLEVAQNYFKDLQAYPKCKSLINLNNLALHWYTQEQLEGKPEKKGFSWGWRKS